MARSSGRSRSVPHRSPRSVGIRLSQIHFRRKLDRIRGRMRLAGERILRPRPGSRTTDGRRPGDWDQREWRTVLSATEHAIPPGWSLRASFVFAREWLGRFPLWIIQFAMRIGVGAVFFNAGLLKLNSFEFAVKLFEDEYKVPVLAPAVAARLAMFNELTFSTLLFLGLATRFATLPLLGMITVIQIFVYPNAWPDHLLWGSILLFLLTRGPGALSLDYLIYRHS